MRFNEEQFIEDKKSNNPHAEEAHLYALGLDMYDKVKGYDFFKWEEYMLKEMKKYYPNERKKDLQQKIGEIWVKDNVWSPRPYRLNDVESIQHLAHRKRSLIWRMLSNEVVAWITIIVNYLPAIYFVLFIRDTDDEFVIYSSIAGNTLLFLSQAPLGYLLLCCHTLLIESIGKRILYMWFSYFAYTGLTGLQVPFILAGGEHIPETLEKWFYIGLVYLGSTILYLIDYRRNKERGHLAKIGIQRRGL